jgi:WD40 repeat protein
MVDKERKEVKDMRLFSKKKLLLCLLIVVSIFATIHALWPWGCARPHSKICLQFSLWDPVPRVKSIAFSPNDDYIAALQTDGSIYVWAWPSGTRILELAAGAYDDRQYQGHLDELLTPRLQFSQSGKLLAFGAGKVSVWELPSGKCIFQSPSFSELGWHWIGFVGEQAFCVWNSKHKELEIWDPCKQQIVSRTKMPHEFWWIKPLENGVVLIGSSGQKEDLYKVDAFTGKVLHHSQLQMPERRPGFLLSISPDGRYLLYTTFSELYIYDASSGAMLWQAVLQGEHIISARFTRDSQYLYVWSFSTWRGYILDVASGNVLAVKGMLPGRATATSKRALAIGPIGRFSSEIWIYDLTRWVKE